MISPVRGSVTVPPELQPRVERLRRVIVATLVKRLAARRAEPLAVVATDRGDRLGLATMCIGLGQGIAMLVERIEP